MSYDIDFDFDRISQEDILTSSKNDILDIGEYYDVGQLKDNIHDILRFLNYYDLDLIYLTYLAQKKQVDLAKLLDQTQPSVSYNLNRIKRQVQYVYFFLANLDNIIIFLQKNNNLTLIQKEMLLVFFYSLTPTKASHVFKMHPITYKNKLNVIMEKLKKQSQEIYEIFQFLIKNFNKIKKTIITERIKK